MGTGILQSCASWSFLYSCASVSLMTISFLIRSEKPRCLLWRTPAATLGVSATASTMIFQHQPKQRFTAACTADNVTKYADLVTTVKYGSVIDETFFNTLTDCMDRLYTENVPHCHTN